MRIPFDMMNVNVNLPNGKQAEANCSIFCTDDDLLEDFENEQDKKDYESGSLLVAYISVEITWQEIEGFDVLGGCWIRQHSDVMTYVRENTMIENAIGALEQNLIKLKGLLS